MVVERCFIYTLPRKCILYTVLTINYKYSFNRSLSIQYQLQTHLFLASLSRYLSTTIWVFFASLLESFVCFFEFEGSCLGNLWCVFTQIWVLNPTYCNINLLCLFQLLTLFCQYNDLWIILQINTLSIWIEYVQFVETRALNYIDLHVVKNRKFVNSQHNLYVFAYLKSEFQYLTKEKLKTNSVFSLLYV